MTFREAVLQVIKDQGGKTYGAPLRKGLVQLLKRPVSYGFLYEMGDKMVQEGLIYMEKGEATAERGWRCKMYFMLPDYVKEEPPDDVASQEA